MKKPDHTSTQVWDYYNFEEMVDAFKFIVEALESGEYPSIYDRNDITFGYDEDDEEYRVGLLKVFKNKEVDIRKE